MNSHLKMALLILTICCLVFAITDKKARAAEGGYSNYIPGTYGDFAMALAPSETWTLRNDFYYYDASTTRSVRSGAIEVGTDLQFLMNFTTLVYKPDIEIFGAKFATGVFVPLVMVTHWQSLYSETWRAGLHGLEEAFRRINGTFGRDVEWTRFGDLAATAY